MNYCQDGLQVYFATETQQYTYAPIYGHYDLQPNDVNGRPYFKMETTFLISGEISSLSYGIWWDADNSWLIGFDHDKGGYLSFAFYMKDAFCPHQLSEWDWWINDGTNWFRAEKNLGINCKCFFFQTISY